MSYEYGKRGRGIARVDLGDLTRVRYKTHKKQFEIVVNPKLAWLYKQGTISPLEDIIEDFIIFDDFFEGLKSSAEDLMAYFDTDDSKKIAEIILRRGELLITQEQRNEFLKNIRSEIVKFLLDNVVNPKTKLPYTQERIEEAILNSGYQINIHRSVEEQAIELIKVTSKSLPMVMENITIQFAIPSVDSPKLSSFLHNKGVIIDENWNNDGSLVLLLRLPSARSLKLIEDVDRLGKGRVRTTIIDRLIDR